MFLGFSQKQKLLSRGLPDFADVTGSGMGLLDALC